MAKLAADRKAGTLDDLSAALVDQLQAEADTALAAPVPKVALPEDLLVPGGPIWDARFPGDTDSFNRHEAMMTPLRQLFVAVSVTAFMAAIEPEGPYREYAVAAMEELAAIDLERSSYLNTHQFHGVVPTLSQA